MRLYLERSRGRSWRAHRLGTVDSVPTPFLVTLNDRKLQPCAALQKAKQISTYAPAEREVWPSVEEHDGRGVARTFVDVVDRDAFGDLSVLVIELLPLGDDAAAWTGAHGGGDDCEANSEMRELLKAKCRLRSPAGGFAPMSLLLTVTSCAEADRLSCVDGDSETIASKLEARSNHGREELRFRN